MKPWLGLSLTLLLLAGCATSQGYAKKVGVWQGKDANELLAAWGAPSKMLKMPNGNVLYTYKSHYAYLSRAPWGYYDSWATEVQHYQCTTNFVINPSNQQVLSIHFQGNDCVAPEK